MRGQLCQQLVRPVVRTCFCFSACKNCRVRAAMPAARAFLSKTFLAVFAFLLANVEPAAAGVSGWLHIPIFTFPLG